MKEDVPTLFEKLLLSPEEVGSASQEQKEAIDLFAWLANALWQIKESDPGEQSLSIPAGAIDESIIESVLPLFEKKGWKGKLHGDNMMLGDGSYVELTRV